MADRVELLILVIFAVLILLLTQSRELMRQIARTAEEWHRMIDALRNPRRRNQSIKAHIKPANADEVQAAQPEVPGPNRQ